MTRVVIVGGGPGGYEAALVARQLGGDVTVVDTDGLGGSAVLTDCVPSKTLIATAEVMSEVRESSAVIVAGGVGYEVFASLIHLRKQCAPPENQDLKPLFVVNWFC